MPSTPFARGTSIHMAIMPWQRLYSPAATIASLFCNRARVIDPVDPTVQSKVMMTMMVVDLMMVGDGGDGGDGGGDGGDDGDVGDDDGAHQGCGRCAK